MNDSIYQLLQYLGLAYVALPIIAIFIIALLYLIGKRFSSQSIETFVTIFKWYMISVAIVFSSNIIKDGFTERETGMKEMQVYDKYVDMILEADNIEKRWKLAEYFATVTPTDRLRERWAEYKYLIEEDYQAYLSLLELENIEKPLAKYEEPLLTRTNRFKVDIFYLGDHKQEGSNYTKAQEIAQKLDPQEFAVRIRLFTQNQNNQSGYHIEQNEIRSDWDEINIAENINELLNQEFKIKAIRANTYN